jgi:hypothetical protein
VRSKTGLSGSAFTAHVRGKDVTTLAARCTAQRTVREDWMINRTALFTGAAAGAI